MISDKLTAADLQVRADLAADRLMAVQQDDGYFLYKFHPITGSQRPGPGNLVRQAGCAYALGRAADQAASPGRRNDLVASASRAIDALLGRVLVESGTVFIAELPRAGVRVRGKLGTLALTLSALQSASLAGRYPAERGRLVDAVLSWQRADGSFRCRSDSVGVADDGGSQDYFPGEALMALSAELKSARPQVEDAMAAAFAWYRAWFRARPTTAFVPWQLEAWRLHSQWWAAEKKPIVPDARTSADFVFAMADWLLQFQVRPAVGDRGRTGAYVQAGRRPGVSTGTYTEAIIRAFSLASVRADDDRATSYRESALMGLDFVRRLQILPRDDHLFRDPVRSIGGTSAGLDDLTIRCDYDQHCLTAYLAAIEADGLLAI